MRVHWYPGHMTKAIRMMREHTKLVDCFICVLDSRAPKASINRQFLEIVTSKPVLFVLNKADMVEPNDLKQWENYYKKQGIPCVMANSTGKFGKAEILKKLKEINSDKIEKYQAKGMNRPIRAMVAGIPNSGKSTLINNLGGVKKAQAGNKAGVTRGKQWVNIGGGIELLDTPGTLAPDTPDEILSTHLAMIGSINDDIIDMTELAYEIAKHYKEYDLQSFINRYEIEDIVLADAKVLSDVALSRNLLLKGGIGDIERASK